MCNWINARFGAILDKIGNSSDSTAIDELKKEWEVSDLQMVGIEDGSFSTDMILGGDLPPSGKFDAVKKLFGSWP